MGIITTIVFGLVVGVIAKFLMPGKNEPQGFVLTAILGIVGSFVGTYLGQMVGLVGPEGGYGWIASIIGAMIVLFVWSRVTRNRAA
jgi:uncharacterized membrane protein YeaQ/YmgE (transglycosylase-associated protein family)